MKHGIAVFTVVLMVSVVAAGQVQTDVSDASKVESKLEQWIKDHPGTDLVKAWVYFKDKGIHDAKELAAALEERKAEMSSRTLWRRSKVRNDFLVDERDLPVFQDYKEAVLALGPTHRTDSRVLNAISVKADISDLDRIAALDFVSRIDLVACSKRKDVTPEHVQSTLKSGSGSRGLNYGNSYTQLDQINVIPVHDLGFSGKGVIVCMMDTGYYKDHEAFAALDLIAEWDFINGDGETQNEPGDPSSQHNHGTYTWSALGGLKDGVLYGPAYGASFLLAKTEDISQEVPIEEDWWTEGIEWAEGLGADVASSSLIYTDWYTFKDMDGKTCVTTKAANWATEQGVVVVNAMGNNGQYPGAIGAPADSPGAISCGAVDSSGYLAGFSSSGPTYDGRIKPDICAMGVSTLCASPSGTNAYGNASGTSLSTPLVGGLVALVLEAHPDWTPEDVKQALHQTADNAANPDNNYGWGIADTYAAIHQTGFSLLDRDAFTLAEGTGGTINFTLNAGTANANRNYILLGGVTGTEPGTPLPGGMVTLPLNWDAFTGMVLQLANTPAFQNFMGALDGAGSAGAMLDTFGPVTGASGVVLYFAYALNNQWDFVSNPVFVTIVP